MMGRNYDYDQSYDETVTNLPRGYKGNKYACIGVCTGIINEHPLFYDAMNECGLCISALAFSGNAHYNPPLEDKENIPSYDFIRYIIGNFDTVESVKAYLENCNITDEPYSEQFPNSDLHWMICDKTDCIVVEQTKKGLNVYDNHYGVLTNNPPFDRQVIEMKSMDKIIGSIYYPNGICKSRGTETVGVKGDTTSMGRFHRVHYYMEQMKKPKGKVCSDDVSTLHLLDLVKQTWGATPVNDSYEYTIYSVIYDMEELEIIIKPYDNTSVNRIMLRNKERRYRI